MSQYVPIYSALTRSLPENVHLLTLEALKDNNIILRLEHFFEKNEDGKLSRPAVVSLKGLFADFEIINIEEMNLSANQKLKEKKMWHWNTDGRSHVDERPILGTSMVIELQPMEIRTFQLHVSYKH